MTEPSCSHQQWRQRRRACPWLSRRILLAVGCASMMWVAGSAHKLSSSPAFAGSFAPRRPSHQVRGGSPAAGSRRPRGDHRSRVTGLAALDPASFVETATSASASSSLLLAGLPATSPSVSAAFNFISLMPQYLWLLLVLAPNWSITKLIMRPLWPVLLFCSVHLFIVLSVASTNPDNIEDLSELIKVFDPAVVPNLFTDFSPQASMMKLMSSPGFVSEEWSHVLAWDLFVGRWIWLDGQKRGIFTSHSVLLCNFIGPPGLLLHAVTCLLFGPGLPDEELPSDKEEGKA